ncbi:MAG: exodeoxyribonuclease V subunit beta, partial [Comamonadaceae bacterium]
RLNRDELHWEARVLQFRAFRQQWRRQGVLPMLRRLLQDFAVPRRLLAAGDERQLTDLLHLAELLQQASALLEGEHALVRHLAEQRADDIAAADARQLRLESDANLLKVVTVHKSKGLEYPLVFVPFACACRPARADDLPLTWHDAAGRLQVALAGDDAIVDKVDRERLGEDLRKLYVALTRARFACWIGVAPVKRLERTAVGYLLAGDVPPRPGSIEATLRAALGGCEAIAIVPAPQAQGERYTAAGTQVQLAREPLLAHAAREPWWIASYSALKISTDGAVSRGAALQDQPRVPETAIEATWLEGSDERVEAPAAVTQPAGGTLHDFPRGPGPGSFLHGLLEWAGREGFGTLRAAPQDMAAQIARRCAPRGWSAWAEPLTAWLAGWVAQPLDLRALSLEATPVSLADLPAYQVEMEFWFAASRVDAKALDALVTAHTLDGAARPALEPRQLHGMLKGFIDLVFQHEGRYYVADYKSNRLGAGDADYTHEAMRAEVLRHRYELQYTLYIFALHRLLRSRLPDYDYERDIGGAVYVFLRGHAAPTQGLHLERPPRALIEALDRLFTGIDVEMPA